MCGEPKKVKDTGHWDSAYKDFSNKSEKSQKKTLILAGLGALTVLGLGAAIGAYFYFSSSGYHAFMSSHVVTPLETGHLSIGKILYIGTSVGAGAIVLALIAKQIFKKRREQPIKGESMRPFRELSCTSKIKGKFNRIPNTVKALTITFLVLAAIGIVTWMVVYPKVTFIHDILDKSLASWQGAAIIGGTGVVALATTLAISKIYQYCHDKKQLRLAFANVD